MPSLPKIFTMIKNQTVIDETVDFVKQQLNKSEAGHDWWHVYRVWKTATAIAKQEGADIFVVSLGALLHDIADAKFYNGDEDIGPALARNFLQKLSVSPETMEAVIHIIRYVSFKNREEASGKMNLELAVVQDADRLDAMGAIGIARTFHYGGFRNRPIYDPSVKPAVGQSKEEYKKSIAPSINHFYEKLLLLKALMNTSTGKLLAEERHRFMEQYLQQFFKEWGGEDENAGSSSFK